MKTLQERLKWARKEAGKSQQEVADFLKITQSAYSQLEMGQTRRSKYTAELAYFLNVNAYWLATGVGSPEMGLPKEIYGKILRFSQADQEALARIVEMMDPEKRH